MNLAKREKDGVLIATSLPLGISRIDLGLSFVI